MRFAPGVKGDKVRTFFGAISYHPNVNDNKILLNETLAEEAISHITGTKFGPEMLKAVKPVVDYFPAFSIEPLGTIVIPPKLMSLMVKTRTGVSFHFVKESFPFCRSQLLKFSSSEFLPGEQSQLMADIEDLILPLAAPKEPFDPFNL